MENGIEIAICDWYLGVAVVTRSRLISLNVGPRHLIYIIELSRVDLCQNIIACGCGQFRISHAFSVFGFHFFGLEGF